ncbi:hypothetical protein XCR1_1960013 [Xenorhabdus cabanillasii JM26]|uniref:Uncharacterized protein n=1 Tax=Xenorhabdus cabanillasii JM26 TaxID=1427517 RepID=W1J1G7_9GAMM|nr:hypothetical protein XCR1_1960013 [Xenorhabdus cabanillasii JM26]
MKRADKNVLIELNELIGIMVLANNNALGFKKVAIITSKKFVSLYVKVFFRLESLIAK